MFINSMFCVKDEKELKEGQIQVLNWIVSPYLKYIHFCQMITDQGQIQFLVFSLLWIPQAFIYLSDSQQENCMSYKYISVFTVYDI